MADLSKIKIGNITYNLKDAQSRADLATLLGEHALAALGTAAWYGADAEVTGGATGVATTAAVKNYVDAQVGAIHNFDVRVYTTLPTAAAETMYILALVADSHGTGDVYDEFITVRSGDAGSYTYAWEKIGNTDIDLSGYVQKTTTIAGIDLQDNITDTELETALGLGDLAYADTASGIVAGETITGLKAKGDISGTATISTTATSITSTGSYTPEGTISKPTITVTPTTGTVKEMKTAGSVSAGSAASLAEGFYTAGSAPSFSEGTFTPNTPTVIDTTKFSGGSKAADTFDAGALPSKAADTFSAGALPTLGEATTSNFATSGITASVGTGDDAETLIFANASTSAAVTAQGAFNQGSLPSFTEGSFSAGSLPSFTEGAFTPASLASGFYTAGTAASKDADSFSAGTMAAIDVTKFNGGAPTAVTLPTFDDATVLTAASAALDAAPAFTGTAGSLSVTGSYEKADASATITANNVSLDVDDVVVADKSVTVRTDAE